MNRSETGGLLSARKPVELAQIAVEAAAAARPGPATAIGQLLATRAALYVELLG